MKDSYLSAAVIFLIPVLGAVLMCANFARPVPFPMNFGFPALPQMDAQTMAVTTATPTAPPALKVVA